VDVNGQPWTVEIGEPLRSYEMALGRFARTEALALPILALLATLAGFYISGRALAPVDRINRDVLQISASNLSARLTVQKSRDELQRLSETLNGMLERIESSFNRNRQFTADASHELRAPLTLIQAAADFSLRRERNPEELREALSQILRESNRTTALIDNLLTLARSDAGGKPYEPAMVNLNQLVEELRLQTLTLARATQKEANFSKPDASVLSAQAVFDPHR
jgi:signal transduction histidine kinase